MSTKRRVMNDDFGKLLKRYRKEKGLTIQKLADLSTVNGSYIHRLETGQRGRPSQIIIEDLCDGLGIDPTVLFGVNYRKRGGEPLKFNELLFTHDIEYNGHPINAEAKDMLLHIIELILDAEWNNETILEELKEIGQGVGELKEVL